GLTSFLTTVGQILKEPERHHVAYEGRVELEPLALGDLVRSAGGEPAHARALEPWLLDLARDPALGNAAALLRHGSFPPRTRGPRKVRFVVAPLAKDGAPFARLVSLEVAGDELVPIFRAADAADPLAAFDAL